jgi:glycosyltransferase involved in cell wall biosynthesis
MLLPQYERGSDLFLFTHLNPACPNNIIEAMACGLPICGVSDGAMTELVANSVGGLLLPVDGNAFWRRRPYNTALFAKNINELITMKTAFAQKSRVRAVNYFSLEKMLDEYESLFNTKTP